MSRCQQCRKLKAKEYFDVTNEPNDMDMMLCDDCALEWRVKNEIW